MAQPLKPTTLDAIIQAAGTVTTRGGFAALVEVLQFLMLVSILVFTKGVTQAALAGIILATFIGFAVFFILITRKSATNDN